MKRPDPTLDALDELIRAAKSPYLHSRADLEALLVRAAREIRMLRHGLDRAQKRLARSDAATRDRDEPEEQA